MRKADSIPEWSSFEATQYSLLQSYLQCRIVGADGRRASSASRQVHPPRPDGGHQPLLAPDQVLAVPAAWPRDARCLPSARRRSHHRRRACRARSTPTIGRTSSRFRSTSPTRGAPIALADHYRAQGIFVALGGLHVTSLPDEAAAHADAIFLGPGEQTFPQFLEDFQSRSPSIADTSRPPAGRWNGCRRSGAT